MIVRILLMPFAWIYDSAMRFRNHLYDLGLKPSVEFEIPVIAVGNLTVAGTGKTPMVAYLANLLGSNTKSAVLSRGYGRITTGLRVADSSDTSLTIGDEPLQLYRRFSRKVIVMVGEDRAYAIANLIHQFPDTEVVILDDAFQHRRVRPTLSILLTRHSRLFYDDRVMPAGQLRESSRGANRANMVVVTKCPDSITSDEMEGIESKISEFTSAPVYFTSTRYGQPVPFGTIGELPNGKVLLVTGIADPVPLATFVERMYGPGKHLAFRDHYVYKGRDLDGIAKTFRRGEFSCVLTTEKDAMRLNRPEFARHMSTIPWFYLPVGVEFLKNGKEFDAHIKGLVYQKLK